jgi:hypothetical protein
MTEGAPDGADDTSGTSCAVGTTLEKVGFNVAGTLTMVIVGVDVGTRVGAEVGA